MTIAYQWRGAIDDSALDALHAAGFDHPLPQEDWRTRLEQHSLGWVCARDASTLDACGFRTTSAGLVAL